jgi:transposase-like protein
MSGKEKRFYSEAFKRQVVREYEQGAGAAELKRKYDIRGHSTLQRWLARYGRGPYREGVVYLQTAADRERARQLEERLTTLQEAVAELTLENRMLRSALEARGLDPKKELSPRSSGHSRLTASPSRKPAPGSE